MATKRSNSPKLSICLLSPHPLVLSEFGGITYSEHPETWGYSRVTSSSDLAQRYLTLLEAIHSLGLFAGFCYTQFADTYQEANGLLTADRVPKFPIEDIFAATTGVTARRVETSAGPETARHLPPENDDAAETS